MIDDPFPSSSGSVPPHEASKGSQVSGSPPPPPPPRPPKPPQRPNGRHPGWQKISRGSHHVPQPITQVGLGDPEETTTLVGKGELDLVDVGEPKFFVDDVGV